MRLSTVWALLALASCRGPEASDDRHATAAGPAQAAASAPAASPPPSTAPVAPTPAGLALPARFTALGTEPFWAAKVDGARLTYSTPEDQAGQAVAVARTSHGAAVEVAGTLAGKRLTLTLSAGPCSDGMSDTVYPFAVRRRLGDDEQRGCARPDG
jgi:uncharacterized membrane protein